ncbi:MAG TPA: alpha/beta hydrolase, partial [Caulobacteraceae bacterium]
MLRLAAATVVLLAAACRDETAPPSAAQPQTAAAVAAAPVLPTAFPDPTPVSAGLSRVELTASGGRAVDVTIWTAPDERAVVVFSHGHGGRPAAYRRIISAWTAAGFTVVAPLHVDSMSHPRRDEFDLQRGFIARIEDLALTRAFIKATHAGKPLIAAGHSFGSLMSLIEAGALTPAGPRGDPDIRAVVAISSAGDIPGVIREQTYAGVTTPLLQVTGDADLVDGWV